MYKTYKIYRFLKSYGLDMFKIFLHIKYDLTKWKSCCCFGSGIYLPSLTSYGLAFISSTIRFNRQQFYILPTDCIYVFYMNLGGKKVKFSH
jgi:hypothetical protein